MSQTIEILNRSIQRAAVSGEKDLVTKVMGRFYTPKLVVEEMSTVIDWQNHTLTVELWDCDQAALLRAAENVSQVSQKLKLSLNVHVRAVDTFEYALEHLGKFNTVIFCAITGLTQELKLWSVSKTQ